MKITQKINSSLWEWVKAICTVMLVGVLSYKVYTTPFNVTVDFPTLLSLLLALFSVALAALFYFKATETSNTFYDNTYTFTKDIAQLLVKIESGFGERLKHLDEGYTSMRDYLQNPQERKADEDVKATKKKIEDEKQEIEKVSSERNEIIQELLEKSQLQTTEKEKVLKELAVKEEELAHAQKELSKMNRRLVIEKMSKDRVGSRSSEKGLIIFTRENVINKIGIEKILTASSNSVMRSFNKLSDGLPRSYLKDMERKGYFDDGLTNEGLAFLHDIIMN